jgi:hypothetical protein
MIKVMEVTSSENPFKNAETLVSESVTPLLLAAAAAVGVRKRTAKAYFFVGYAQLWRGCVLIDELGQAQTDGHVHREKDMNTDRQTASQIGRQTDTDRQDT